MPDGTFHGSLSVRASGSPGVLPRRGREFGGVRSERRPRVRGVAAVVGAPPVPGGFFAQFLHTGGRKFPSGFSPPPVGAGRFFTGAAIFPTGNSPPPAGFPLPPTGKSSAPAGADKFPAGARRFPTGFSLPPTGSERFPAGNSLPPTGGDLRKSVKTLKNRGKTAISMKIPTCPVLLRSVDHMKTAGNTGNSPAFPENSPALPRWDHRTPRAQSPARDGRTVLPSLRDSIGLVWPQTQR